MNHSKHYRFTIKIYEVFAQKPTSFSKGLCFQITMCLAFWKPGSRAISNHLNTFLTTTAHFVAIETIDRATGQKYGVGVLIVIPKNITALRRLDLESYEEGVWLEVKTGGPKNLLIRNYYLPPSLNFQEVGKFWIPYQTN